MKGPTVKFNIPPLAALGGGVNKRPGDWSKEILNYAGDMYFESEL